MALLVAALAGPVPVLAQGEQPSPVRFTEVQARSVARSVTLPGTVESTSASQVASEVDGVVEQLAAQEGEAVAAGAPLVRLRTTNLELRLRAAQGQLKEAAARLDLAQRNLERARELFDSGVISRRDFDDAFSDQTAWQGRVDALDAEIERIRVDLARCTIRAPFRGVVVLERTEVGQWVGVGDAVMDVAALDWLEVRVDVPETYFSGLRAGATASVSFESLPGLTVEGRVTTIVPRAAAEARTFPIKVRVPNRELRIGVGMLARVDLPLGRKDEALLVPKDAIVRQGERQFVYKIKGDDTIASVDVTVGRGVGAWVVVEGPLKSGERVVTRGNERLQPGQAVAGRPLEYELP